MAIDLTQLVFTVKDEAYNWADVLTGAELSGAARSFERWLRARLACHSHARTNGSLADAAAMNSAEIDFRQDHHLVSADDARAWLERWEVAAGEWRESLSRSLARDVFPGVLPDAVQAISVSDDEVVSALWADLVCQGWAQGWSHELALRVALFADGTESVEPDLVEAFVAKAGTGAGLLE